MHMTTKMSSSQGNRVCQYFNSPPQGWDVWERRIKAQESQCGKQELGHRCGHPAPGLCRRLQADGLPCLLPQEKNRGNCGLTRPQLLLCQENWKPWSVDAKIRTL